MTRTLVLLRHGESEWNKANLFTGWVDADLSERGRGEAMGAGRALAEAGVLPSICHTSVLVRAIRTAQIALDQMDRLWIPVRRSWRLNERHYGDLTGQDKREATERFGEEQVRIWRRSYDVRPPAMPSGHPHDVAADPRYAGLPRELVPSSECLKDVVERMLPWWYDALVPDLAAGHLVLVSAHGNSLRALVKHLDGISDEEIASLNLPTGVPLRYDLGDDFRPLRDIHPLERVIGDPEAARAAAEAVARQAG